jgi:hypothetical protein
MRVACSPGSASLPNLGSPSLTVVRTHSGLLSAGYDNNADAVTDRLWHASVPSVGGTLGTPFEPGRVAPGHAQSRWRSSRRRSAVAITARSSGSLVTTRSRRATAPTTTVASMRSSVAARPHAAPAARLRTSVRSSIVHQRAAETAEPADLHAKPDQARRRAPSATRHVRVRGGEAPTVADRFARRRAAHRCRT